MAVFEIDELFARIFDIPVLFYAVVGLILVHYLRVRERLPDNVPPFPVDPYPILGHVADLGLQKTLKALSEWRNKVGDIFSLKFGSQHWIVINSYEHLREAFVKKGECFANRPIHNMVMAQNRMETTGTMKGLLNTNGPVWKEQRTISMQILREFGMGKNWLAEKITEEVEVYLTTLSKFNGQPKNLRTVTSAAVSNVICAILIGQRFELDDPYFVRLLQLVRKAVDLINNANAVCAFPVLKYLPGDLFDFKKTLQIEQDVLSQFSVPFIQRAKENKTNNFITSYLAELDKKQKLGLETTLDEENLSHIINQLFAAGSESTGITIVWAVLYAIRFPEAQEKCYQEILEFVGTERLVTIQDKSKMNYVNAYAMETQRASGVIPLGLRECTQTVEVGGYTIPAGTTILPNLHAILHDEKTWGDPLVFRPARFLDENNQVFVPDQFVPFSIGRRYCIAESLARVELYLFIANVIQRFHVLPEDPGNLPSLTPDVGLSCAPKPFSVRLVERKHYGVE